MGLVPEVRFYLGRSKGSMEGYYVAPFVRYQHLKLSTSHSGDDLELLINTIGGGVVFGRQWILGNFIAEVFAGPSYDKNTGVAIPSSFRGQDHFSGFFARLGVKVGVGF